MRYAIFALGLLVSAPAAADGFTMPTAVHRAPAYVLNEPVWQDGPIRLPERAKLRYTTTYLDGVATRFGLGSGDIQLFQHTLPVPSAPDLVGTFDNGAAIVALRWHPGE